MIRGLIIFLLVASVGTAYSQLSDFDNVDFTMADSIAANYKGESLKNLPMLAHKLTAPLPTQLEKFRAIYTWVSANIENDYGYYVRNKKKREKLNNDPDALESWNREFRSKAFEKLRKDKSTVCTGYAYLVSELAGFAGISSHIIDGYGRTVGANVEAPGVPNHSWNAVKLNGKWYLCDATWSSGSINLQKRSFLKDYNDGYFLADPELFVKNHYPLDTAWLLTDTHPSLETFLNGPLVYKYAFSNQIQPVAPVDLQSTIVKGESLVITIKSLGETDINLLTLELSRGSNNRMIKPKVKELGKALYELSCTISHKGTYDVHLKSGEDYILTYVVRVNKEGT